MSTVDLSRDSITLRVDAFPWCDAFRSASPAYCYGKERQALSPVDKLGYS